MKILFRISLAIYAFCLTVISILMIFFTIRPYRFFITANILCDLLKDRNILIGVFAIEFIFLALSVTFLSSGIKSNKINRYIIRNTNTGEIKISLDSVEGIALSAIRRMYNVKDLRINATKVQDKVSISIKITIVPESASIPTVSEDIQLKVKKAVEDYSGIKVNDIKVLVENICTLNKPKVE